MMGQLLKVVHTSSQKRIQGYELCKKDEIMDLIYKLNTDCEVFRNCNLPL